MSKPELALVKTDVFDVVEGRVEKLSKSGELHLPGDYSAANALKSAWLILQSTLDRDKKPVLTSCTRDSIANALFDMIVQGLSPAKSQCYFIAYGNQLTCQRSYFGTMAVAKRANPAIDEVIAQVVYEGDELVYNIVRGKRVIQEHKQALGNIDNGKIAAAYAMIIDKAGDVLATEVMSWEEILQSWKQSQVKPVLETGKLKPDSTHAKFPGEMAKRTVINRVCKPIINASNDKHLVAAYNRAIDIEAEDVIAKEIAQEANQELLDFTPETPQKETKTEQNPAEQQNLPLA